jgi:hypothetical protein
MKKAISILSILALASCTNGKISPCADTVISFQTQAEQYTLQGIRYGDSAAQAAKAKDYISAAAYATQAVNFGKLAKQATDSALYYTKNCPDSTK